MTKVDIFSGFLGAGKTTLIKKLLSEAFVGEKLVLIENEFGEIGIDGGFLKEAGVEITEMNSGCICCSLVGDFGTALKEVLERFSPDRIIIEPSGVGKLSDVMKAVQDVAMEADITLNSLVTIADATKCKMYMKNFGEFYNNQIEYAKTIVLSRTQKMKEEKLIETIDLIKDKNGQATIITTNWDEIDGSRILAAMEQDKSMLEELLEAASICPTCGHSHEDGHEHHHDECCHHDHEDGHEHHHDECCHHDHEDGQEHHHDECCHHDHDHHHDHHHADEVFTSWGIETPAKFEKTVVEKALQQLSETDEYGTILRAKGILAGSDGRWIYFDMVPGEYELREGAADVIGKLCVIGVDIKEEELKTLFFQ